MLPSPYKTLTDAQIRFKTGVTSLLAGEPGSFKSTLALNFLEAWVRQDVSALYIAAEDDELTIAKRLAAIMTGDWVADVERTIRDGTYDAQLREFSKLVHFEFRSLRIQAIAERMEAFKQMHGAFPNVLVIDNLMSMVDDPTDYHGQMTMVRDLSQIAATAPCHVLIMHHTKEHPEKRKMAPQPPPRWEIHGKVSQFPKLILTVDTVGNDETPEKHMGVAPVKNTDGPQDKTGRTYVDFMVHPEQAKVYEL
jgi:RecA-family ATPase